MAMVLVLQVIILLPRSFTDLGADLQERQFHFINFKRWETDDMVSVQAHDRLRNKAHV